MMKEPPVESSATTTFVVRFWTEWTGTGTRWRGRIEQVQSGERMDFLTIDGLLRFLERFGIRDESRQARS